MVGFFVSGTPEMGEDGSKTCAPVEAVERQNRIDIRVFKAPMYEYSQSWRMNIRAAGGGATASVLPAGFCLLLSPISEGVTR